ncbi:poly(A) RNA polymerase cid12 [Phtheirospermum japonicum]|uniref:Poly(A) RNA polymerase cid12 n=1 Tax=Phtheirospermum japonicum TaxID=374723 RepID=A0A830BEN8_9LAMI|nr:poly(A) RNA polymerase cid12 [Phtheirospermum japonicum]
MTAKMGDLGVVNSKGNISSEEARVGFGSGWKSCPPPDPASIRAECLSTAEEAAEQVLNWVHPTLDSEEKRRDVIDCVQQLVQSRLNCEDHLCTCSQLCADKVVVSYGSVPLKTYLPDGDIDLTVLKGPNAGESLAQDVLALLQKEEQNENAEYQVKDTQFIDAEVKLVKCFVRNFVIDISFNQLGGLSTLCFLEQVDRLVGRDHLFKRSIILIKTWCYYESRILGAHHGLISTYALEILVLYVFHHFHSSLSGPLSALYRFLDYYSQFDWENYCISLKGPVCKSSLPDIVVKMPEGARNDLLLSEEFLENCLELFSVPSRGLEANSRAFQPKHLNIIDPLRENNNLGRSVHRGNFYRIRSAFKFGSHKLGQVLSRPRDKVADEICNFFTNTRARHEHHYRSSIRCLALDFGDEESSFTESLSSPVELFSEDDTLIKSSVSDFDNGSVGTGHAPISDSISEACYSADGVCAAKYGLTTSNSRNGTSESSNYSAPLSDTHFHKSNHFSKPSTENGSSDPHQFDLPSDSSWSENRQKLVEMNNTYRWCMDNSGSSSFITKDNNGLENASLDFREIDSTSIGGESEVFNPLADLSGDYDGNIRSLLRGQLCNGFSSSVSNHCPSSPPIIQNRKPWDIVRQSMPSMVHNKNNNKVSQMNSHTVSSTDHILFAGADSGFLGNAFHFDEKQKARGIGTYFPQTNFVCMEMMPSHGRGKNKAPPANENNHYRHGHIKNGFYHVGDSNSFDNGSHEVAAARKKNNARKRRSDVRPQSNCSVGGGNQKNGCFSASSCRIEFGSIGNLGEEVISGSAHVRGSVMERDSGRIVFLCNFGLNF